MVNPFQPWIEKYRPSTFDKIVLDKMNHSIVNTIVNHNYLPNLLLYGPPGTGKTTTIINLSKELHSRQSVDSKGLVIHLNASDERGIDTIRNQINHFVNSSTLFSKGTKIVILDEVDYMTKSAQQALKCLIDYLPSDVRFCLICNYINRIDESIRDTFVRLRFNQLPQESIIDFLEEIVLKEGLSIRRDTITSIQQMYHSDIRSMINYIQTNQAFPGITNQVLTDEVWARLLRHAREPDVYDRVVELEETHALGIVHLIKQYAKYMTRQKRCTHELMSAVGFVLHHPFPNEHYTRQFFVHRVLQINSEN